MDVASGSGLVGLPDRGQRGTDREGAGRTRLDGASARGMVSESGRTGRADDGHANGRRTMARHVRESELRAALDAYREAVERLAAGLNNDPMGWEAVRILHCNIADLVGGDEADRLTLKIDKEAGLP